MKRLILLATLVTAGGLSLGVAAFQQPPANAPKVVEAQKLRDNLYMLTGNGGGGNTAVFIRTRRHHHRRHEKSRMGPADPR